MGGRVGRLALACGWQDAVRRMRFCLLCEALCRPFSIQHAPIWMWTAATTAAAATATATATTTAAAAAA